MSERRARRADLIEALLDNCTQTNINRLDSGLSKHPAGDVLRELRKAVDKRLGKEHADIEAAKTAVAKADAELAKARAAIARVELGR